MYLTVREYAEKNKITRQAVMNMIKAGQISKDRLKKNDSGFIIIKERDYND